MYYKICVVIIILAGSLWVSASSPKICRVQGGHTRTIWGTGFMPGSTEIYSINIPFDEYAAIVALESGNMEGSVPLIPPHDAKKLNILDTDPKGLVMAVEFSDQYSGNGFYGDMVGDDVIWVKNQHGFSAPWLVKSPKLWFAYPETTTPGSLIRVFGRNLDSKLIAIRKDGEKKIQVLKSSTMTSRSTKLIHHKLYETELRIPAGSDPGKYQIYIHNGSGGISGWSNPIEIQIKSDEQKPKYFDAKKYGVQANGYTDDTKALKKALLAASVTGGTVVLQPGCVIISETIEIPMGVSLRGNSECATSLQILSENPIKGGFPQEAQLEGYANDWQESLKDYTPMIWVRNNSLISNLSLVYGAGTGLGILVARCSGMAENIKIEHVKVLSHNQPDNWLSAHSVLIAGDTYGLLISDCDFRGWGGIEVISSNNNQAYIGRNKIVIFPTGITNSIFTRGMNKSVVESNEAFYGLRNYSSQSGRKYGKHNNPNSNFDLDNSVTHLAVIGNVFVNNLARRHNDGEMMIESGHAKWWGNISDASDNSVTVNNTSFDADFSDNYVMILDGKGIGQYRRIISNTKNQLTLDRDWDIIPDQSTVISVGGFNVEHLWIDNSLDNNASWSGFWGNNVGHVVDGQIMRDGGPFYLWAWCKKAPTTVAFIDIIGTRTIGGGGIGILGSPAFGNTVRYCETIDFRYYPNFHSVPKWLQKGDPSGKCGIFLDETFHDHKNIPATAPLNDWNIFEANHIADGLNGIYIDHKAKHNILKKNVIRVDNEEYLNHRDLNVIIK